MKCGVRQIVTREGRAAALVLDSGEEITADHVISTIGTTETENLLLSEENRKSKIENQKSGSPRLSYVETITVLDRQPAALGWGDDTIVFFNDSDRFDYARPAEQVDLRSGVICLPNNFDYAGAQLPEGLFRVTCLANHEVWSQLTEEQYQADKLRWFAEIQRSARRFLPRVADSVLAANLLATDMFTPRTVRKFTGHLNGAIYGAPRKIRDGRTHLSNLYLCGTDQGFLGIVGAMLSGISMANYHILQKSGS